MGAAEGGPVEIDLPDRIWEEVKKRALSETPVGLRAAIRFFFEWVSKLDPEEVKRAIREGRGLKDSMRGRDPDVLAARMALAGARGFLKSPLGRPWRRQAEEFINKGIGLMVLRHENPETYKVIEELDGDGWFERCIEELKELLGLR